MSAVQLEELPAVPLAVIRRTVPGSQLSRVVPECCGLVWNALKAQQIKGGRNVAVYLNNDIAVEVGVELAQPFAERDGLVRSATPAGLCAFTTHMGPYGTLGNAHDAIHRWAKATGQRLAGPRWEIYGHWQNEWVNDPSLIRTDVYYQVVRG